MTITTRTLTQAAGISAATAGAIFAGVQIKHPAFTVEAFTDGISWHVRSIAKLVMAGLALAGLAGRAGVRSTAADWPASGTDGCKPCCIKSTRTSLKLRRSSCRAAGDGKSAAGLKYYGPRED